MPLFQVAVSEGSLPSSETAACVSRRIVHRLEDHAIVVLFGVVFVGELQIGASFVFAQRCFQCERYLNNGRAAESYGGLSSFAGRQTAVVEHLNTVIVIHGRRLWEVGEYNDAVFNQLQRGEDADLFPLLFILLFTVNHVCHYIIGSAFQPGECHRFVGLGVVFKKGHPWRHDVGYRNGKRVRWF